MISRAECIFSDIKRAVNEGSDDFLSFHNVSKEDVDLVINSVDQNLEGCVRCISPELLTFLYQLIR